MFIKNIKKNILNFSGIFFGHICVWFTLYLECFLILRCCAMLLTSFRSPQSSLLLPSRHTPFHVLDLCLVLFLSFLEHSCLLFHKTAAVLRWWSPRCSGSLAFSQSQERKMTTMFFSLLFDFELFGGLCVSYNFKTNLMQNPQKNKHH